MNTFKIRTLIALFLIAWMSGAAIAAKDNVHKIIFEDQKIEGKIRRPQLVLITADERPQFHPMIMQSLGKTSNITASVNEEIIEDSPYKKAFQFNDTKISNYVR